MIWVSILTIAVYSIIDHARLSILSIMICITNNCNLSQENNSFESIIPPAHQNREDLSSIFACRAHVD